MPKMYQNTFAGRAPPGPAGGALDPLGELKHSPDPLAAIKGSYVLLTALKKVTLCRFPSLKFDA